MVCLLSGVEHFVCDSAAFSGAELGSHLCCNRCFAAALPQIRDAFRKRCVLNQIWPDDTETETLLCQLKIDGVCDSVEFAQRALMLTRGQMPCQLIHMIVEILFVQW